MLNNSEREMNKETSPYMSADEVMRVLGYKKSKFYDDLEKGLIPSELPEGRSRGHLFPREAITIMAHRLRKERSKKPEIAYQFVPSTHSDVWNAVQNARRVYGPDDIISFERALEWRDQNPDISMSVHQGKHLTGMVTYLPLEEEVTIALARDRIREKDIPLEAIRKWGNPNLSVYIAGIAIIPTKDRLVNRHRGRFLIAHAIKWAITLTSQYDIRKWYAVGVTAEGQALLEHLGFREMPLEEMKERFQSQAYKDKSILSQTPPEAQGEHGYEDQTEVERKAYILDDFLSSRSRLIQHFLQKLPPETNQ